MPQIITIASQKGGAGKTALAINLAVAAVCSGELAALIDLDPQASVTAWAGHRDAATPPVHTCNARGLSKSLERATASGACLIIIDTAPRAEAATLAAARAADLVLLPCRPTLVDLHAVPTSIEIATVAGTDTAVVLNAVPTKGTLGEEARETLTGLGVRVLKQTIGQRVAIVHAYTRGLGVIEHQPQSKAADELRHLHKLVRTPARAAAA